MKPFDRPRALEILKKARRSPIAVVGDVMLDAFIWGRVSRISPEAPVPVVDIREQTFHLGGAANVAHNIKSLGGAPQLLGVVGDDEEARRLKRVLEAAGLSAAGLLPVPSRPTTVKTRIIAHQQQIARIDRESREELPRKAERLLIEKMKEMLERAPVLVLSDYAKGLLTSRVLAEAIRLARRRRIPVLVDPKLKSFSSYRGASLVTPNAAEAEQASGIAIDGLPSLGDAARRIQTELDCRAVVITRGEEGMSLFERGKAPLHIAASAREVFDVTGAGDTVIASLAIALAAGATLPEAAALANRAAGIVVGKLGTATVKPEELLGSFREVRGASAD